MLIDHIAWLFVNPFSGKAFLMHFIGRLTGPVMAVFLAEGYIHTRDVNKYTLRLAAFAVISWPCFSLMEYNAIGPHFGVIYTLLLSLIAIRICDSDQSIAVKAAAVLFICILSIYGDWPVFGVLYAVNAFVFYDRHVVRWVIHSVISLSVFLFFGFTTGGAGFHLGTLLTVPLLALFYNGESGSRKPFHKWFFYVFYPLHMLVLWLLKYVYLS